MRLTAFISITVFHLVVSAVFGVFGVAVARAAIDGEASTFAVRAVWRTLQFLFFPITALSAVVDIRNVSGGTLVTLFLGNSIVWGALAATLWSWYQRHRERAHGVLRRVPLERRGAV
jgi:hypothetical protein